MARTTTRMTRHINAPARRIYQLLTDGDAIARWKVPAGMTCRVHSFEARVGGVFRVSLTYSSPQPQGKSSAHTDTYHGHFVALTCPSLVVESLQFETADPALSGPMTITYHLTPMHGGTQLLAIHEGVPEGIAPADNELGWRMSLDKLAALAETASEQDNDTDGR